MKNRFYLLLLICFFCSPIVLAGSLDNHTDSLVQNGNENTEEVVSITGKSKQNVVYFKLLIKNENKASFYSMVREFSNGDFESVQIQNGVENNINTPIMYTFRDCTTPVENCTYTLYRISDGSEVMKKWSYNYDSGELSELPNELVALND